MILPKSSFYGILLLSACLIFCAYLSKFGWVFVSVLLPVAFLFGCWASSVKTLPMLLVLAVASPIPIGPGGGIAFVWLAYAMVFGTLILKTGGRIMFVSRAQKENAKLVILYACSLVCICYISLVVNGVTDFAIYAKLVIVLVGGATFIVLARPRADEFLVSIIFAGLIVAVQISLQVRGLITASVHTQYYGSLKYGAFVGPMAGGLMGSAAIILFMRARNKIILNFLLILFLIWSISIAGYRTWLVGLPFFLAYMVFVFLSGNANKFNLHRGMAILVSLTMVTVLALTPFLYRDALLGLTNDFLSDMESGRLQKWSAALNYFSASPFFGIGFKQLDLSNDVQGLLGDAGAGSADSWYINL